MVLRGDENWSNYSGNYWLMVIDKERTELPLETKYKLSRERDLVSLPLGSNRLIDSSWLHFIFEVIF